MPEERGLYPKMRVEDQLRYHAEVSGLPPAHTRRSVDRWVEVLGLESVVTAPTIRQAVGNREPADRERKLANEKEYRQPASDPADVPAREDHRRTNAEERDEAGAESQPSA